MKGVLLCGGQSLRMGHDKGMLKYQSETWVQHQASVLSSACPDFVVSVNDQQFPEYKNRLPEFTIIQDDQSLNIYGPLKGIISIYLQYPTEDLLVLACDMIDMKAVILNELIEKYNNAGLEASVFMNGDQPEPLCGIYSSKALQKLVGLYRHQQLTKHSMKYALGEINTNFIPLPGKWESSFRNYNNPGDIK